MNELVFFLYLVFIIASNGFALYVGKEALIVLVCLKVVLMNLLVPEEIALFGLHATAVDALAVGTSFSLNLLNEYYGLEATKKAINLSIYAGLFYVGVSFLHRLYMPVATDHYAIHFNVILSLAPRIILASCIAYFISQKIEAYLYAKLKASPLYAYFIIRNYASLSISQAFDTIIFTYLGLYGVLASPGQVILVSYSLKILTCIAGVPLLAIIRRFIPVKIYY